MWKTCLGLLVSLFMPTALHAQDMQVREDSLTHYLRELRTAKNDSERVEKNKQFKTFLAETLREEEAFTYPFDSLTSIAKLYAPDKAFRLFNWNIEHDNGTHTYYAYVLTAGKNAKLIELIDQSVNVQNAETRSMDNRRWYGALYYDIIVSNTVGRTEYTLLGWDGNNRQSSKKIIEVMVLAGDKINFGAPVFHHPKDGVKRRVILEFSALSRVMLRYDAKEKMIIFDHLMPETETATGIYEFYYPDGSYDAYRLENGKWNYVSDVDARRGKDRRDRQFNDPLKDK